MIRLQLEEVRKAYSRGKNHVVAVDRVTLQLARGEVMALTGPSGCGKSTLLMMAGGLLAPDEGQVLWDEFNVYQASRRERASRLASDIGFVFQQFHLLPYLSVLDNVLASTLGMTHTRPGKALRDQALKLLEQFGLVERRNHVPGQLSTGERQRTALARALLHQPKILLADEPTGNLDPDNARVVLSAMREFAREGGSVLLVTHAAEAADQADRTIRLRDGRLVVEKRDQD